jgi:hypothetical protein
MKARFLAGFIVLPILFLFLLSCAGGPPTTIPAPQGSAAATPAAASMPEEKVYEGSGRDASMLTAMNKAKMDAVRKAVIDMIGVASERANQEKLEEVLYSTQNPNAFVNNETFEAFRKDKVGQDYIFEARVAVKMRAVENTLKAHGLFGETTSSQERSGEAAAASAAATSQGAEAVDEITASAEGQELSAEEKRVIARYVNNMTYMVYFNEEAAEDPFYMKAAVGIANEYLTSNSMEAIDYDQVERLKEDQKMVYEEQTGQSISIIQWIAQKLNADVYIEIDGRTSGETSGDKYYGQANITLKGFEASTGRLLGSQPWNSPRTFSTASEQAARINALQTSVYKAMPMVLDQARAYMAKALQNGIKYELIIQDTADSRVMSDFYRKMRRKAKDVRTISQSAEQTTYEVYLIGSIEDLVDAVYDVADTVAGLQGIYQVVLRGKSVTFNTGL